MSFPLPPMLRRLLDPRRPPATLWAPFVAAVVALAAVATFLLEKTFEWNRPFFLMVLAGVLCSWIGGRRAGWLAMALSISVGAFALVPPRGSLDIGAQGWVQVVLSAIVMLAVAELGEFRFRSNQKIREEQDRLQVTLASIGDGVVVTDATGRISFMNPRAEAATGWRSEDARGREVREVLVLTNERTGAPVESPISRALRRNEVVGLENHTVLRSRDGRDVPIDDSAAPIRSADGRLIGAVLVFRDVTKQRRLDEAQARLAVIVESSDDAIASKSLDGTVLTWNRGAERVFGWTAAEMVGQSITKVIPPELADQEPQLLAAMRRGEHVQHFETERVHKDGRRITVSLSLSPIRNAAGEVVAVSKIARDITERRALEEELLQAQKMEGIGRLAGGIAHDFNNLLTAILGYGQITASALPADSQQAENLRQILKAGERGRELASQLLSFARKQMIQPRVTNLNDVVTHADAMLRRLIGEDIELVTRVDPHLGAVRVDPTQFEQVLV
ncbi:MAG TPA: PAS domain S-box protein, partial [Planctomycetota bacterium]|nr:PAS domain S-box protein [Planctomycetota bacterium]